MKTVKRGTGGTLLRLRLLALMLFPICLLEGQTTNPMELIKQATPPASERLAYGDNPLQIGELRLPAGEGPFPIAILVHGGCWDGPPDLEADRAIEQRVCGGPVITEFAGGTPARFPERYREGSASGLLPIGTRQEIFVAGTFGEVWMTLFKQYVAAAEKAGDPVRLVKMTGAGHFDGINPQVPAWQGVLASIQSLVGVHMPPAPPEFPPVAPVKPVIDDYYGIKVSDPCRYMEKLDDPAVQSWFRKENDYARTVLSSIPGRGKLLSMPASDSVYCRDVDYLLRTQQENGTCHVMTRAFGFQAYLQSGFPYGHDQWISQAGTATARIALTFAAR